MAATRPVRPSPRVRADQVPTAHGPLGVLVVGRHDVAPALLVPGYTGSKEDFLPDLVPLADAGFRVAAMDLRGQAHSPGTDDPARYSMASLAEDVGAVLTWLGRPAHLVGHSFGGLVCRQLVIEDPGAVSSFTLMDSGPAAIPPPRADLLALLAPVLASGGVSAVYEATEALARAQPGYVEPPADVREFLRWRFLAQHPVGLEAMADALLGEPDRVAELRATGVPMLVLYGADDDAWPPAVQAAMAERLGARRVVVPAAVHSPAVENPVATVAALVEFWRAVSR